MFASLIVLLLSAIVTLLPHQVPAAGHGPAGSQGGLIPSFAPSAVAPAPSQGSPSPASVAPPTDVAEQLPTEITGRQIDCPDGVHVGVMTAGAVTGCP